MHSSNFLGFYSIVFCVDVGFPEFSIALVTASEAYAVEDAFSRTLIVRGSYETASVSLVADLHIADWIVLIEAAASSHVPQHGIYLEGTMAGVL